MLTLGYVKSIVLLLLPTLDDAPQGAGASVLTGRKMRDRIDFDEVSLRHIGQASILMTEALQLLDKAEAHQAAALLDNAIGVMPPVARDPRRSSTQRIAAA